MFWEEFKKLCKSRGETPTGVCAKLGISISSVTAWKNGSEPQMQTLQLIADHFGVPVKRFESDKAARATAFWENYSRMCKSLDKSPSRVAAELGIAGGLVTKWKNGSMPTTPTLQKLAKYFGVEPQDLFKPSHQAEDMSAEKQELIRLIDSMTDEEALKLAALADMLLHK